MNRKNVTRTITAIAVVVLLGWSFFYFSDDTRGYKPVDTSVAITQINGDNVKSAQIDDREQQLRLILKKGNNETDGSEGHHQVPHRVRRRPVQRAQRQKREGQHGRQPGQHPGRAAGLRAAAAVAGGAVRDVLPHARRRPDGLRVRQVTRQATEQGHAQDHLRRRRRCRRGGRGALRDQGLPAEPQQVPSAGRQDPQRRAALRAAGNR